MNPCSNPDALAPCRGPQASPEQARAKYDEIGDAVKADFPEGEADVNRRHPDMAEAARLQNLSPGQALAGPPRA